MRKPLFIIFGGLGLAVAAGPAIAEKATGAAFSQVMTQAEIETELLGVELKGDTANDRSRWSECIEPDGDTVYLIDGEEMLGRMDVATDGQVCFSYEYDDHQRQNCFKVTRAKDGYTFWGGQEGVFYARQVRRGIETCPSSRTPIF